VVSSGWSFVSAVLGQMTYLVASFTPESARSYVMQGASFTQGTISSIPIVGSISPEVRGQYLFVRSILNSVKVILLARSIPMGWAYAFYQDKASSVRVPVANVTLFSLAHLL
ncbi:hypothetical protein Tco_1558838, partial [Tanacetum coccineum]